MGAIIWYASSDGICFISRAVSISRHGRQIIEHRLRTDHQVMLAIASASCDCIVAFVLQDWDSDFPLLLMILSRHFQPGS